MNVPPASHTKQSDDVDRIAMATKEMMATRRGLVPKAADATPKAGGATPTLIMTPTKRKPVTTFTTEAKFEKKLKNTNDVDAFINLDVDDDKDLLQTAKGLNAFINLVDDDKDLQTAKDLKTANDDGDGEGLPEGEGLQDGSDDGEGLQDGSDDGEGLQDGGDDGDPYIIAESQMYPGPVSRYGYEIFADGFQSIAGRGKQRQRQ